MGASTGASTDKGSISGQFDVELMPLDPPDPGGGVTLGRMSISKRFHGPLQGTSRGQMLSAMTSVEGSAGYVAVERVTGTLAGRSGSFVLQHAAVMNRGTPELHIRVVPDSATDQLIGLTGTMRIRIENGQHWYDFDYEIP